MVSECQPKRTEKSWGDGDVQRSRVRDAAAGCWPSVSIFDVGEDLLVSAHAEDEEGLFW